MKNDSSDKIIFQSRPPYGMWVIATVIFIIILFLFWFSIALKLINNIYNGNIINKIAAIIIISIFSFTTIIVLLGFIIFQKVKIYETGVIPHYRPITSLNTKFDYFIPFKRIKKIGEYKIGDAIAIFYFLMDDGTIAPCDIAQEDSKEAMEILTQLLKEKYSQIERFTITGVRYQLNDQLRKMINPHDYKGIKIKIFKP